MHDLTITKDENDYWICAKADNVSDIFLTSLDHIKKLSASLDKALKEHLDSSGNGYKIQCDKPNCFTIMFGSWGDSHYHGYCLSKSKLTAFRNQLMGVLNG